MQKDSMLLALAQKIFGSSNDRTLRSIYRHIDPINALEKKYEAMNDEQLKAMTVEFRERLAKGETEDDIMHDAFAVANAISMCSWSAVLPCIRAASRK
jgi:preprotein translocase subunit SecA